MSAIYGISTLKKSILQGIPKPGGTIIVAETLTHTNIQKVWIIGRNSEKLSRKQNKSSFMIKSIKSPIRDMIHGSS